MNALDPSLAAPVASASDGRPSKTGDVPPADGNGAFDAVFKDVGRPEGQPAQDASARRSAPSAQTRAPSKEGEMDLRERKTRADSEILDERTPEPGSDAQTAANNLGASSSLSDILALVMNARAQPEQAFAGAARKPQHESAGSLAGGLVLPGHGQDGEAGMGAPTATGGRSGLSGAEFAQTLFAGLTPAGQAPSSEPASQGNSIAVTVLARETHFAPVQDHEAGVLQQLAAADAEERTAKGSSMGADERTEATASRTPPANVPQADARAAQSTGIASAFAAAAPVKERMDAQRRVDTQIRTAASAAGRASEALARSGPNAAGLPPLSRAAATEDPVRDFMTSAPVAASVPEEQISQAGAGLTGSGPAGAGFTPSAPGFMPTASLAQIGDAIASELSRITPDTGGSLQQAGPGGPVRVLEIALSPEDLGRVTVRLRLTDAGLEVRLRASNPETARMLEQDQAALGALLRSAGVEADTITITGSDTASATQLMTEAGQRTSQGQGRDQKDQGEGDRAPRDNNPNGSDRRQSRQNSGNGDTQDDRAHPRRPGPDGGSFSI
ncbi:MAG: hypothetical protein B7Z15_02435 [Rhizobiales bacterium 32-66-8]|nr:MAG: hypothetical protein B7Z15_02435 [Rhizobiales bacterium 32-66-8]